jgi:hypothetical protein
MILDFSFYLFIAVVFTGLVWLIDKWILAPRRNEVIQTSTQIHQGVEVSRKGAEPFKIILPGSTDRLFIAWFYRRTVQDPVGFDVAVSLYR